MFMMISVQHGEQVNNISEKKESDIESMAQARFSTATTLGVVEGVE